VEAKNPPTAGKATGGKSRELVEREAIDKLETDTKLLAVGKVKELKDIATGFELELGAVTVSKLLPRVAGEKKDVVPEVMMLPQVIIPVPTLRGQ
jgi:hypothetical protein